MPSNCPILSSRQKDSGPGSAILHPPGRATFAARPDIDIGGGTDGIFSAGCCQAADMPPGWLPSSHGLHR
jgi:hypothetical protein